jgi:hypothetical protein
MTHSTINWDHIRKVSFSKEKPPSDWPAGVAAISIEGVSLLGIHQ